MHRPSAGGRSARCWTGWSAVYGGALGVADPHAAAARELRAESPPEPRAKAPLVGAQESERGKQTAPPAVGAEEDGVGLVVHPDAPDERRDARPLRPFEQVERDVRIVRKPGRAAPYVCVVRTRLLEEAIQTVSSEAEWRNYPYPENLGRRFVGRRDSQLDSGNGLLQHPHDAGDYRLIADVVAAQRDSA